MHVDIGCKFTLAIFHSTYEKFQHVGKEGKKLPCENCVIDFAYIYL